MSEDYRQFIGVSFGVIDQRLVCIATSCGYSAVNPKGFTTREALTFLESLSYPRNLIIKAQGAKAKRPKMVMFDSAVDLELLLQDLKPLEKDVLFGIYREKENRNKDTEAFDPLTDEYKGVVNGYGFTFSQLPGKLFKLKRKDKPGLMFYDISSFFGNGDIDEAAEKFLKRDPAERIERNLLPLWQQGLVEQLLARCEREAETIEALADKVALTVEPLDLSMRHWYGPSAIASRCLHKWEARKQARRITDRNSPYELVKAVDCAYFGGRVENLKLGTIQNVRTYDLNSAYAFAVTMLSQFYQPLRFTRSFPVRPMDQPFSVWLVDYDLPASTLIGILPTRHTTGGISFRRRGKGYFWQPEVDYLARHYPDCFRVKWGYVGEYEQVKFAPDVERMYEYRNELKAQDDKGEKIIKLALANLYGKFAQNQGQAHFQCRAWAGWITSFVRRLLLEAITGIEDSVICFAQDAIHVTGTKAQVPIGEALGQWKTQSFESGLYVAPGIYDLRAPGGSVKTAIRGGNLGLDFERLADELTDRQVAHLERSFFVGWQLSRQHPIKFGARYLNDFRESLSIVPSEIRGRHYSSEFNWSTESRDSKINSQFSGRLSARYFPQDKTHSQSLRLKLRDRGWK